MRLRFLLAALLLGVVLVLAVGVYALKAMTLPQRSGRLPLAGLSAAATIERDEHGVLRVEAKSLYDLYFAQGVAHAQERLWQMEFQRRLGAGRLAEVLGEGALPIDRFMRTLGVYRAARRAYEALSPRARDALDAYVAGINAYLATRPPLPLEFRLLGFRPEPFKPEDALVWAKLVSWDLSKNYERELLRFRLLARGLSKERINALMPPYPEDAPRIVGDAAASPGPGAQEVAGALARLSAELPLDSGLRASNSWALAPKRTRTGGALLANDPHLRLQAPSIWILMELVTPGRRVVGASFPGLPGIVIGTNGEVAWGITNLGADVQDLYVLEEREGGYLYKGEVRPYVTREEEIQIKGGKSERIVVRESVYGPVISDVVEIAGERPLSLRWVSLDDGDTTLEAFLELAEAQDFADFSRALSKLVAPNLSFVYADRRGNIGYVAAGRIPRRREGHSGAFPVPGDGRFDWQGYLPYEDLPRSYNPPRGYVVTANQKPVPEDFPHFLGVDWAEPFRAERIEALLLAAEAHDLESTARIQLDEKTPLYGLFRSVLELMEPKSERGRRWLGRLLAWDGDTATRSEEAAVFEAWYTELSRLPEAEVGERYWDEPRYLRRAMLEGDPACEARGMSCLAFAAEALEAALMRLGEEVPLWGQLHPAVFAHPVMSKDRRVRWLFERRVARGGDGYTVNVAKYRPSDFVMTHGPSYRQIVDLRNPEQSLFIHTLGQSGHPLSAHYADLLPLWARGRYLPMGAGKARARLVLEPAR